MANYRKEIAHMLDRMLIKVLHQDKAGFYKKAVSAKLNLLDMLILRRLEEIGMMKLSDMVSYLEVDRNVLTTSLKRLQSVNLICKRTDSVDGRAQIIVLSEYGEQFVKALSEASQSEMDFVLQDITVNEEKAILKFLSKIVQYHTNKYELDAFDTKQK
ncbi:MAG: hypothetical protein PWP51_774 [Clostridiales bacterium]|jgi:DNA-binding MarR family transcriptional regulator|nr:hypothetical protein [Clostridiales bacterium]MDN5298221.1 hypothetical protein [Clostridiales bacterium]